MFVASVQSKIEDQTFFILCFHHFSQLDGEIKTSKSKDRFRHLIVTYTICQCELKVISLDCLGCHILTFYISFTVQRKSLVTTNHSTLIQLLQLSYAFFQLCSSIKYDAIYTRDSWFMSPTLGNGLFCTNHFYIFIKALQLLQLF